MTAEETTQRTDGRGSPTRGLRVAFVLVALAVSALFCELLLRVVWENPYRLERPTHVMALRLQHQNRNLPVDRSAIDPEQPTAEFRTDARAYILPSRRFEEPDGTVAFLGGSTTENRGVQEPLRFPALVSTLFEERGLRVNTLNAGMAGNNAQDALNLLLNHVVYDAPDAVVLMEAANDIGFLNRLGSYESRSGGPMTGRMALQWLAQRASSKLWLVGALHKAVAVRPLTTKAVAPQAGMKRATAELPSEQFVYRLRAFARICRSFDIEPVLMTQPVVALTTELTPDWLEAENQVRFNELIRIVAREEGAVLIDLAQHVQGHAETVKDPKSILYDGVHLSDRGSRIAAELIEQRLWEEVFARR